MTQIEHYEATLRAIAAAYRHEDVFPACLCAACVAERALKTWGAVVICTGK